MTELNFDASEIDTSAPHPARMYDFFLGGKDNYRVDWEAAEKVQALMPQVKETARANREFMHRASRFLARRGVSQFLDVGTGIPTEPNLHQVVQAVVPSARVVYADNDPIVLRHAEALLAGAPEGRTAYAQADVKEPGKILSFARDYLDFDQPIVLSVIALMPFILDEEDPYGLVAQLLEPMAAGSYLMLSHVTSEFDPAIWDRIDAIYRAGGTPVRARHREEILPFFHGLGLCDPGLTLVTQWRPDSDMRITEPVAVYAGVARKG
ncbi:SAM-dependent methyltransferase [Streptomyces tauricus]|uniref:SAM-dependent methyltransferase n=1 Tax=Streptomyces tauricus TaxID=68274 RepID=UPI00224480F2|nr:SAM-dependent methyltransferase [Streptomyces tauricus]MCW8101717.1 SAM-dependent methyltransferase [Streptomyces tauricus]